MVHTYFKIFVSLFLANQTKTTEIVRLRKIWPTICICCIYMYVYACTCTCIYLYIVELVVQICIQMCVVQDVAGNP